MNLSVVIPTYNEKDNLQTIIKKIFSVLRKNKIDGEIIVVDDNSPDGTGMIADELRKKYNRLRVIHRRGKLGLSSAVIDGFKIARGDVLGVMDADSSHPPEDISSMYNEIIKGTDFVIGSRYVKGGEIRGWNFRRKVISRGATLLAKLFTKAKDPMSGFFMIKKECVQGARLNPKGFKICLELLVKAKYKSISEVPITFTNRRRGKSKISLREYYLYLSNLFGYLKLKSSLLQFMKFCLIGSIGTVINVAVLYFLTEFFNVFYMTSALFAFIVSVTNNFVLNKAWTFKEKIRENIFRKYTKFFTISIIALVVNLTFLYWFVEYIKIWYVFAQVLAIGASLLINFFGNKIWTFRER